MSRTSCFSLAFKRSNKKPIVHIHGFLKLVLVQIGSINSKSQLLIWMYVNGSSLCM